ncbi:MAG: BrnT family toxin [Stellaceae bacterium]
MLFEVDWDEPKRISNIKERGVDFRDAALIFEGAVLCKEDAREDYREQRFRALGRVDNECYVVAYTWRGSTCRIISAWKLDEDGRKRYEKILS